MKVVITEHLRQLLEEHNCQHLLKKSHHVEVDEERFKELLCEADILHPKFSQADKEAWAVMAMLTWNEKAVPAAKADHGAARPAVVALRKLYRLILGLGLAALALLAGLLALEIFTVRAHAQQNFIRVDLRHLGGTVLTGANVVDGANTAFRVNCVTGCAAGASFSDRGVFTFGTTSFTNVGGVFDDTPPADLTTGLAGAFRLTPKRSLHINLRNQAGTEIGTSANPIRFDPTGTTTEPISAVSLPLPTGAATEATLGARLADATFTARINTQGQKAMAASTPVVVASDQSAVPVSGTVTDNQGTPAVLANAWPMKVTDATNGPVAVKAASTTPALADPALVVALSPNICGSVARINGATGNIVIVAGTAARFTYICNVTFLAQSGTTVAVSVVEGTGAACATGLTAVFGATTPATGGILLTNGTPVSIHGQGQPIAKTGTLADDLCIAVAGTTPVVDALVSYHVAP